MPFEWKLEGLIWNDPKISLFVRLKTLAASGIFCLLFAAVGKKQVEQKGFCVKTAKDGSKRQRIRWQSHALICISSN
jgi:hypothetical protein